MNIIFAGTPAFAVPPLQALIASHKVVAVFTQPDRAAGRGKKLTPPPVKQVALEHGIEVYQPISLRGQSQLLESLQADVMIVVAYGLLLPQAVLDAPRLGCLNIHASLLPRWRGAAPIQRAIEAGDAETGVCIMQMELGLDSGPVYETVTTGIASDDTSATLHDRLSELGATAVCKVLQKLSTDPDLTPIAQDDGRACYARKITKQEARIDWQADAALLERRIRAFNPWPIAFTLHGEERIRLLRAHVVRGTSEAAPGTIIAIDETGPVVQCGAGALRLELLQRAGGRVLTWQEFRHGYDLQADQRFD
ncbi:MAG: methionyl-tRNA formyltransferase [Gammaproteobacteria bacterium]|nr:methionyl-tRNA formyltransferase [Gammaproteobacteria bacterium]